MITNSSVWTNYRPGFVDPLYQPYQRQKVEGIDYPVYTWKNQGGPPAIHPEQTRVGWGQSFQRKHYGDPCPEGFTAANNDMYEATGWCVRSSDDFRPIFYTDKYPGPMNQYFNGPTVGRSVPKMTTESNINPITGGYTISKNWNGAPARYGKSAPYNVDPMPLSYVIR